MDETLKLPATVTFLNAWIQKGTDKRIKANTGRQRLNINGAIDIKTHEMHVVFSKSVNAQSNKNTFFATIFA